MSGENMYYLMHDEEIVAVVEIEEISGSITRVSSKVRKELLPPGGIFSAKY